MQLPLNLIIFCTTIPKYGHGNNSEGYVSDYTYERTINSLFKQVNPDIFKNKLLHLKTRPEEEDVADKIKSFCESKNINVLETKAEVQHHSEDAQNHAAEYFKDVYKAFSQKEVRKQKYTLWLEDDYLLRSRVISLTNGIKQSIKFLDENPEKLCVRFNLGQDFHKPEKFIKHCHNIYSQDLNYTQFGPTFTFQPNITRTNEAFITWKAAQNYLNKLDEIHCEIMSGHLFTQLTDTRYPFSFFNPKKIVPEHIG